MTHFYGRADMDAARAGDPWAITRLGNLKTLGSEEFGLYCAVIHRLKTYRCSGEDFKATDDAIAIRWCSEFFIGSPSDYLIERVTRTETRRRVQV